MALLYRAIWHDELADPLTTAHEALTAWMARKGDDQPVPLEGSVVGALPPRFKQSGETTYTLTVARAVEEARLAFRAELQEETADGVRWDTVLRVWRTDELSWLWVDVEGVGPGIEDVAVKAPWLVRDLLDRGAVPAYGHQPVSYRPRRVEGFAAGQDLVSELARDDRTFPVVVFAEDTDRLKSYCTEEAWHKIVETAAQDNAGVVAVVVADEDGARGLNDAIGRDLGVWGGAFRMYPPHYAGRRNTARRSRFVPPERYTRYRTTAASTITRSFGPHSATRRPPASFEVYKEMLGRTDAEDWEALLEAADVRASELDGRLQDTILDWHVALDESSRLKEQLDRAQRQLKQMRAQLTELHVTDESWAVEASSLPFTAQSPSEALEFAREHLSDHLVIPDTAPRDLDVLDADVAAGPWGDGAWRAFRALHNYGEELARGFEGDFWNYCQDVGEWWPATSKKLAMSESETVESNPTMRRKRVFAVDSSVDPSGEVYMGAHIKIAEGGGDLAPRIYFAVQRGAGKVHVGFFGPHKHVPNTRT